MRIVSWNINAINEVAESRLKAVVDTVLAATPDVAVLQEVGWKHGYHRELNRLFKRAGYEHRKYSGREGSWEKRYGNMVVSKNRLRAKNAEWASGAPWPQLFAHVDASTPEARFDLIGVHIPNGSNNGWAKIESLEALAGCLSKMDSRIPFVIAGDFNEPRRILEDGTVIPFGMYETKNGSWSEEGTKKGQCGRTFPRARWVRGVRALLGETPSFELRHAWLTKTKKSSLPFPATHIIQSNKAERFFDHILVSSHWKVKKAGYDDSVRESGLSDHSLAWAELQLKG